MLTEEFLFPANSILFLTEYHKVEVLKVTTPAWFILTGLSTVLQIMIAK
jgi:hypothetical protein